MVCSQTALAPSAGTYKDSLQAGTGGLGEALLVSGWIPCARSRRAGKGHRAKNRKAAQDCSFFSFRAVR